MKKNPFASPRYIILSVIDTLLIVLAVMGYVELDVLDVLGESFKNFVFENWLALKTFTQYVENVELHITHYGQNN